MRYEYREVFGCERRLLVADDGRWWFDDDATLEPCRHSMDYRNCAECSEPFKLAEPSMLPAGTTLHVDWTWDPPTPDPTLEGMGFRSEPEDHEFPTVMITLTNPNGQIEKYIRVACRRK